MLGSMPDSAPVNTGNIDFNNTEIAFRSKSNIDLERAYWLFKIISVHFLSKVGPPITSFAIKIGLPIKPLIKATIFKHFCGGETIEECENAIKTLAEGGVGTILDYSVEGEEDEIVFDETCREICRTIDKARTDSRVSLSVFKITGLIHTNILEKLSAKEALADDELQRFQRAKSRVAVICKMASDYEVKIMIDAEESWIQNAIDAIALEMMRKFNKFQPIVYNTYQLYRNDILETLKSNFNMAKREGFYLGAKIVRGAYMEKERLRAEENGYPSPIHATKLATDADYDAAVRFCIDNLDELATVVGTHNEASCRLVIDLVADKKISPKHPHLVLSQLLGMSDNFSFNLANAGFNVAKYVPYGPVKAVLPYLFRRAKENTSIAGQASRELDLIVREKKRRKAASL
ncbi:MAG: proline dehydrogenase [Daejeonella sp.]|nr:proline dehydrogenase [Daejeonella sp.]